jgi:hypothetical protein
VACCKSPTILREELSTFDTVSLISIATSVDHWIAEYVQSFGAADLVSLRHEGAGSWKSSCITSNT